MTPAHEELYERLEDCPFVGILRGVGPSHIQPISQVIRACRLQLIEVTMNTEGARELISALSKTADGRFLTGAGTVTSEERLDAALDAGAQFIVMPGFDPAITQACHKRGVPFFPGGLTPTEVQNGWSHGAAMVKLFPASLGGPSYIKDLKGPFDDVKILACGGIRSSNAAEYFAAGADALAFGGSVFDSARMNAGDWNSIKDDLQELLDTV